MFLHFDELLRKMQKWFISWKSTKTVDLVKTWKFSRKLPCFELLRKRLEKVVHFVKKHEKWWIWSKLATFWTKYHVFTFRWTFRQTVAKTASFREKARKLIDLAKTMQLFQQATMSFSFWWTFKKKVAKSASSREKARKIIDFVNLQLSEKTTMFWRFDEHCSKKLRKAARAVKKHEKSSIWPNLCKFSNKLRCFCISMNFQGKSCQKCFVSWKSTKNRRFVENSQSSICRKLATFPTNYHVLTFWWTFERKVAESASFSEKTLQIIDWAKTCNFFEQSTMFIRFDELFSKRLQKVPRFVKKHEKSSIRPKLATFRTNYHLLAFRWTFQEKNAKTGPFREKARTLIDLAKTCNFSKKLPCFGIWMIIAGKSCKKVEKVAHFVKNDEKSSIWPKLATFRGNYHVSAFLSTFQQKVSHFVKKHEKSSFGSCLAHS